MKYTEQYIYIFKSFQTCKLSQQQKIRHYKRESFFQITVAVRRATIRELFAKSAVRIFNHRCVKSMKSGLQQIRFRFHSKDTQWTQQQLGELMTAQRMFARPVEHVRHLCCL